MKKLTPLILSEFYSYLDSYRPASVQSSTPTAISLLSEIWCSLIRQKVPQLHGKSEKELSSHNLQCLDPSQLKIYFYLVIRYLAIWTGEEAIKSEGEEVGEMSMVVNEKKGEDVPVVDQNVYQAFLETLSKKYFLASVDTIDNDELHLSLKVDDGTFKSLKKWENDKKEKLKLYHKLINESKQVFMDTS